MTAPEFNLIPTPITPPDLIAEAIAKLKINAGAVFEPAVLELLRAVRGSDPASWARHRQAIKETKTISLADLDKLTSTTSPLEAGSAELFPEVVPWPEPVDGALLLHEVAAVIKKHVIADTPTIYAATLWAAFTWFIDVVNVAPIANITAPEKRCGKTVMLGTLARLSRRPLAVSNIAPAALFRSLELWAPTLLIDEVDAFLGEHEEARGILNAGFTRDSAFVIRCVGDDHMPTRFNVWGAKALCGIGKIADTLADRSIPLRLRRKLPGERTTKIRHTDAATFDVLTGKLARFAIDNREAVRLARPAEIEGLNDRANDCWEPLLAISGVAGGDWTRLARQAAITLHGLEDVVPSTGAELLADIKAAFERKHTSRLFSADLLQALCDDDEAPWATWNRGKAISPRQLSAKLAEFGVKSKDVRQGYDVKKGYHLEQFRDAFDRYLSAASPDTTATLLQPSNSAALSVADSTSRSATKSQSATLQPTTGAGCSAVAGKSPLQAEEKASAQHFGGEL
ncbi:DUF3631 domain-containing protein [Pseudomonas asiatica]|uniref:DUF3631 domain-containing protein n=1 Tax=Pseudomonas asiatica TaxID=2219225 RepID=A0A9X4D037_9PSED|nr:DUF3631 domain-containing protein [Pseudomonas asiatica]MDD2106815.1 DUF3631 domain-containing protein [Pseudomonas asiatica]